MINLTKNEKPKLIQIWIYRLGGGHLRILTNKRDDYISIKIDPKAFLDFIREETIKTKKVKDGE